MNEGILRRGAGMMMFVLSSTAVLLPLSASAATHSITLEQQIIHGEQGDRVSLGTFDTPSDLIGQECSVTASGNNNESVHPGNDIEVASDNAVVLEGVEDSANKTTTAAGVLTLADSISFTLVLGPDGVYSAELEVTLDCQPATTTTTTTEPTSTTEASTTTTTAPPETSSTSITSTTVGESTTTTETTTTTVAPEVSPTTTPSTTVGNTSDTLPFTGIGSGHVAWVAWAALSAGIALVFVAHRTPERD